MTEKELYKLKRQDILKLLLIQVQEAEALRGNYEETQRLLAAAEGSYERLKKRLDSKDTQINKLKGRLDKKDAQILNMKKAIEKLREEKLASASYAGSIAEASLQLSGIFEAAQRAADLYLENIKRLHDETSEAEK